MLQENSEDLKLLKSTAYISASSMIGKDFEMKYYIGPNEYDRLASFGEPFARYYTLRLVSFGTINRYVILPLFSFLNSFMGNMGIIILLMTFIVKLVVFHSPIKCCNRRPRWPHSSLKLTSWKQKQRRLAATTGGDHEVVQWIWCKSTRRMFPIVVTNAHLDCFVSIFSSHHWISTVRIFVGHGFNVLRWISQTAIHHSILWGHAQFVCLFMGDFYHRLYVLFIKVDGPFGQSSHALYAIPDAFVVLVYV